MPGRKVRKSTGIVKQRRNEDVGLVEELAGAEELTGSEEELAEELTSDTVRVGQKMSDLDTVLREIREFRRETVESLNAIREDIILQTVGLMRLRNGLGIRRSVSSIWRRRHVSSFNFARS
uniref:Uncharacterized protein n=1 Tax=Knipowitschia caucasica TaxID=637954 RepID=A0AAV2LQT7_KNICA